MKCTIIGDDTIEERYVDLLENQTENVKYQKAKAKRQVDRLEYNAAFLKKAKSIKVLTSKK